MSPTQFRWDPFTQKSETAKDFVEGIRTVCGQGSPEARDGLNIHIYMCNASMVDKVFYNSDGDLLIVPQTGNLNIRTEMGILFVQPNEFCVIPRGIKFSVSVETDSNGYILEVFDGHFELPDLGVLGANGLADPRHFQYPIASLKLTKNTTWSLVTKFGNKLFQASQTHSPFDVAAWHGNYAPYKYDLRKFSPIGSVSFDHPDPSIYTVLTCKSANGSTLADFAVFPPRWMVAEHTFRPPYYHRNCMAEFMGLISGSYDAKAEGFLPGGASLHNLMSAHGPDSVTFEKASAAELTPVFVDDGLAFMFETNRILKLSQWALESNCLDGSYYRCWE